MKSELFTLEKEKVEKNLLYQLFEQQWDKSTFSMARPENNNQLSELKEKCFRLFKVHLSLILSQIKEKETEPKQDG